MNLDTVCDCSPLPVCTVPPGPVTIPENNTADVQVVKIICGNDVSLTVTVNPEDLFYILGTVLMLKKGLDFEVNNGLKCFLKPVTLRYGS